MKIALSGDQQYPIKFDDGWDGHAFLHYSIIRSDKEWHDFINALNTMREQALVEYFHNEKIFEKECNV